jgi:hypothetical protein
VYLYVDEGVDGGSESSTVVYYPTLDAVDALVSV